MTSQIEVMIFFTIILIIIFVIFLVWKVISNIFEHKTYEWKKYGIIFGGTWIGIFVIVFSGFDFDNLLYFPILLAPILLVLWLLRHSSSKSSKNTIETNNGEKDKILHYILLIIGIISVLFALLGGLGFWIAINSGY